MEQITKPSQEITCSSCGREWTYTGSKEFPEYTSCPSCTSKVRVPKKSK